MLDGSGVGDALAKLEGPGHASTSAHRSREMGNGAGSLNVLNTRLGAALGSSGTEPSLVGDGTPETDSKGAQSFDLQKHSASTQCARKVSDNKVCWRSLVFYKRQFSLLKKLSQLENGQFLWQLLRRGRA